MIFVYSVLSNQDHNKIRRSANSRRNRFTVKRLVTKQATAWSLVHLAAKRGILADDSSSKWMRLNSEHSTWLTTLKQDAKLDKWMCPFVSNLQCKRDCLEFYVFLRLIIYRFIVYQRNHSLFCFTLYFILRLHVHILWLYWFLNSCYLVVELLCQFLLLNDMFYSWAINYLLTYCLCERPMNARMGDRRVKTGGWVTWCVGATGASPVIGWAVAAPAASARWRNSINSSLLYHVWAPSPDSQTLWHRSIHRSIQPGMMMSTPTV